MTHASRDRAAFFKNITVEQVLLLALSSAPLFVLTVRGWSSGLLIVGSLLCFAALVRGSADAAVTNSSGIFKPLFVLTLLSPVLALGISSVLRSDHVWANYDGPARFLIAIPVFLLALRARANVAGALQYIAPVSLLLMLLHQLLVPQPYLWGPDRMSTYFSGPLVFGYVALTLGLISAASIHLLKKDNEAELLLKVTGLLVGLYLSAHSGSRTGWLAIPVILALWLYRQCAAHPSQRTRWVVGLLIALLLAWVFLPATVAQRVALAYQEIETYNWVGIAPETSVGLRITFFRIAVDLFTSNPFLGFGDTRYQLAQIPTVIHSYATPAILHQALTAGYHNEIVSNSVRSGLAGLVSSLLLFFAPIYIFSRHLNAASKTQRANAWLGLIWMLCLVISSVSIEVFDLKYTASFHALMIALLVASTITPERSIGHEESPTGAEAQKI